MIPRDSIDFYPTPDDLANELVGSAMQRSEYGHRYFPGPVLEPSAGNGALAFAIERACDILRGKDGAFVGSYGNPMKNPHNDADNRRLDLDVIELSAVYKDFSSSVRKIPGAFNHTGPAKQVFVTGRSTPSEKWRYLVTYRACLDDDLAAFLDAHLLSVCVTPRSTSSLFAQNFPIGKEIVIKIQGAEL